MLKKINNQSGFTAFEIVIVIVAMLAIGAAGYFAYQARQDKNDYSANVPHKKTTAPVKSSQKVLEIKELGFKMTLPPGLEDLEYRASTDNKTIEDIKGRSATFTGQALFGTKALASKDAQNCSLSADGGPLGAIERLTTDTSSYEFASGPEKFKKVGSFYLTYSNPQSYCSLDNKDLQDRQHELLKQAFDSAQPL